jgi:hypothetical protein
MDKKKIIKVTFFHGDADMSRYISKEFFKDYIFEINNLQCIECDFWIIYGGLPIENEAVNVNPKNIFLITAEFEGAYSQKFLRQFEKVITIDTKLQGDNLVYDHVGYPWFINNSFDELYHLDNVKKTKLISIIASDYSNITYTRNYKIRYDFVMALKHHFGDKIDVFGRGFNTLKNKDEGLVDYKFSIAIENMPIPYNISEKLTDCFLTHTFPLYYDCPNINRFYDNKSYAKLDIMDHDYSIKMIENILETPNYYENHLNDIIKAKKEYLLKYSFQATLVNIASKFGNMNLPKEKMNIRADNQLKNRIKLKLINSIHNHFK